MPLFELEKDGKTYEVDAPDMQSAASALVGPGSWSDTFAKAKANMPSPMEYLKSQFTNPIEDVKNVGKLALGGAEHALGFSPEQQISNEQQVASDFAKHYGNYLSEQGLKENIAQDPTGTLTDVLSFGYPAARAARGVVGRAITPNPARPGFAEAANTLQAEGVPQTAGQITGRRGLKYAESELGGGATMNILDKQSEAFTRAASRRIGEDTPHLDSGTINNARKRIGGEFDTVGLRNNIPRDPQLDIDLQRAVQEYNYSVPVPAQGITGIAQALTNRPYITGQQYNMFRSRLSRLQRTTHDPQMQTAYADMQNALDDAMERSLQAKGNTSDLERFATARRQWRNFKVLETAMATGPMAGRGLLTPQHLEAAAARGPNRPWYARGLSDFSDLGKAGRAGMEAMPESGTAVRAAIRTGTALAGGLLAGGGSLTPEAVAGTVAGIAAPPAMGRVLMSKPVQSYLGNQLVQPAARAPGKAIVPAVAAGTRREAYQQTESVLSPEVMAQVKRFAPQELNAWLNARSPDAALALAKIIAQKANRPDLIERIVKELTAG